MRYEPPRRLVPWVAGVGALLGGIALGLSGRWVLQRQRLDRRKLVPASHAFVPYVQPRLPDPVHAGAIRPARDIGWTGLLLVFIAILLAVAAFAYGEAILQRRVNLATAGVAERAIPVMLANGCAGCHTIPGVPGAQGLVGPRLDSSLSSKLYLGGVLPNNRQNMIRWLRSAREIAPHTAMPSTAISEQEARDVAAYLYALR